MAKDWSIEDRRHRERLERSASVGERANRVGALNRASEDNQVLQRGAAGVLAGLREGAQGRARTVNSMNSRHSAWLARSERNGGFDVEPDSNFDHSASDPGNEDDSRFEHGEPYAPDLRAGRVRDADGSMAADAGTCASHWDNQGIHGGVPESAHRRRDAVIAAARARASRDL